MMAANKLLREQLVEELSNNLDVPEEVCDRVVMWVYKDTNHMLNECSSIEISGFGNFIMSKTRVESEKKKLEKLLERTNNAELTNERKEYKRRYIFAIETLDKKLEKWKSDSEK